MDLVLTAPSGVVCVPRWLNGFNVIHARDEEGPPVVSLSPPPSRPERSRLWARKASLGRLVASRWQPGSLRGADRTRTLSSSRRFNKPYSGIFTDFLIIHL